MTAEAVLPLVGFGLAINLLIFVAAGRAMWLAGTRLSRYADEIANRTGVRRALIGALLLVLAVDGAGMALLYVIRH